MDHLADLFDRHAALVSCGPDILAATDILVRVFRAGGQALFAGNGGSAADADHWSGELLKGFESKRPLGLRKRTGLPVELASRLQDAVAAIPLTGFAALRTAVGNDIGPDLDFAQLVLALGRPGDVFVGLSTSGNARNVSAAAEVARWKGMDVIGLTGAGGGTLKDLCTVCIRAPSARTCHVQEMHLPIYHAICLMIEDQMFASEASTLLVANSQRN